MVQYLIKRMPTFQNVIVYILLVGIIIIARIATAASPSRTATNTHIVSFVKQQRTDSKHGEINDFDHNSFDMGRQDEQGPLEIFFERLLQTTSSQQTDDLIQSAENTLENSNNQQQMPTLGVHQRFKQSIPVLEPVRHLLNTVRDGGFNHTTHFNKTRHHLVRPGEVGGDTQNSETASASSAIETEAEREMVNESTSFQILDFLGTIGGMIWGFFMDVMKWFAASSGNASAASSSGSF